MLAIDPGTSIVNTGDTTLFEGHSLYRWYQSIVLPVGFVNLGLDKTLRKIGVVFVPKFIYKQSCKLFPQPFWFQLYISSISTWWKNLPHGQRLHHVQRTSSTLMTSTSSTLMTSTSSSDFNLILNKDFNLGYH